MGYISTTIIERMISCLLKMCKFVYQAPYLLLLRCTYYFQRITDYSQNMRTI